MKPRIIAVLSAALFATGSAIAQVPPDKAEATFTVHNPELEWKLWASEPLFANPTSIDIDHLGRVWVCESVNYRTKLRHKPLNRPEGDRILILEDSKGTGKADKVTVFYQSPDLLAPLGIAVAKDPIGPGWKVYVCHSPDILVFEDKDGDGHADGPPKVLLHGFRGIDHDHGVHGILIGPDGKFYFSVGDQGVENLQSSDGKGRKWTTNHTDCQAGTLWRCDMDGKNLELIAHNFRNPYESCVDSFGNIWMSDNDDDGNQQTRICYVMPGGNYGYWPRGPGESHWHEEQPGVVPKVLRTYFGSPTGMCVYEGTLLPKKYWGMPLHVDAGPRQVRCYHTKPKGAGYEIDREDIVTSTDNWFRPSDICVAPDGSVFVADWYDPGVGGHGMGDTTRGRIYRLAPKGNKYKVPRVALDDKRGWATALNSPNIAVRSMANAKLKTVAPDALFVTLDSAKAVSDEPWFSARLLWELANAWPRIPIDKELKLGLLGPMLVATPALTKGDDNMSAAYIRVFSEHLAIPLGNIQEQKITDGNGKFISTVLDSYSVPTRRVALVAFRNQSAETAKGAIIELAKRYDGHDRFYLAAIGIAVGTDPQRREIILADFEKQFPEWNDKVADLVWELRPPSVMPKLAEKLTDSKIPPAQRARIVDILATSGETDAGLTILKLLSSEMSAEIKARAIENLRLFLPGKWAGLAKSTEFKKAVGRLLENTKSQTIGLKLVAAAKYTPAIGDIAKLADHGNIEAIRTLGQLPRASAVDELERLYWRIVRSGEPNRTGDAEAVTALGTQAAGPANSASAQRALIALQRFITAPDALIDAQKSAIAGLAASRAGTQWLIQLKEKNQLPPELVSEAGRLLRNSPFQGLRNRAMIAFPVIAKLDIAKLPSLSVLAARRGDVERGKQIMLASLRGDSQCMKCHAVRGVGGNVGPDLATIGTKASRENLFESILYPSKAIADQFVQWNVTTTRGVTVSGLMIEDKPDHLLLRDANGEDIRIERRDVSEKEKNPKSIMPDDIARTLTEPELVDLVEYLVTLQTGSVK